MAVFCFFFFGAATNQRGGKIKSMTRVPSGEKTPAAIIKKPPAGPSTCFRHCSPVESDARVALVLGFVTVLLWVSSVPEPTE